jgi:hypothetical protein
MSCERGVEKSIAYDQGVVRGFRLGAISPQVGCWQSGFFEQWYPKSHHAHKELQVGGVLFCFVLAFERRTVIPACFPSYASHLKSALA